MTLTASVSDVRRRSDLDDYSGELRASVAVRDTDGGSVDPMTVEDFPFGFDVPCTTTPDTTVGSTCAVTTTADAVLGDPNAVLESTAFDLAAGRDRGLRWWDRWVGFDNRGQQPVHDAGRFVP